ncbi:MAG: hypothetical protein EOP50_07775, partial [Sphingobacteriales bacterium]
MGYKIQLVGEPKTYPLPEKYNRPGYTVRKVPYQDFVKKVPGNAPAPNYYMYLVRASAVAGPIIIVFFDQELNDLKEFVIRGYNVIRTEFGDIHIPDERISHSHPEVTYDIVHEGISALNLTTQYKGKYEFWRNPEPKGNLLVEQMIVYKPTQTQIFRLIITQNTNKKIFGGNIYFTTGFGSGVYNQVWPDLTTQWSGVVQQVATFKKKDNPEGLWMVGAKGRYSKHLNGVIDDDGYKNYDVIYESHAKARTDRKIVEVKENPQMRRLNHWEQALGQTVESIDKGHILRIYLNDGDTVLQLETDSEAAINVVDSIADPQMFIDLDFSRLYGLTIKKLVVPMFDVDYYADTTIVVGFDQGPDVLLVP